MCKRKLNRKSNKDLKFIKDKEKSYVYIEEKGKTIGILMWHYKKEKWVYEKGE